MSTNSSESGFTIVELLIVIIVSVILAGIIFGPLDDLYKDNTQGAKSIVTFADTRGTLRSMERKISLSYGFLATSPDTVNATSWTASSGGNVLITNNYATTVDEATDSTGSPTRQLTYATDCTTPILNTYVYFVTNGTLYRRTIQNTTSTCGGNTNAQVQTCAVGYVNASCKGVDAKLMTGVTSFTVQYYASPESTTTVSDPTTAKTVVLNLSAKNGAGSTAVTSSSNLRITRVNGS